MVFVGAGHDTAPTHPAGNVLFSLKTKTSTFGKTWTAAYL